MTSGVRVVVKSLIGVATMLGIAVWFGDFCTVRLSLLEPRGIKSTVGAGLMSRLACEKLLFPIVAATPGLKVLPL